MTLQELEDEVLESISYRLESTTLRDEIRSSFKRYRKQLISPSGPGAMCPYCGHGGIQGYDKVDCLCPNCGLDISSGVWMG